MRVLIAHSWYLDDMPSGENRAVEEDIRELQTLGIDVVCALPESLGPSFGGVDPSNKTSVRQLWNNGGRLLEDIRPDIVHMHHPYPEYMRTLRALRHRDIPLVHTVHNMRHLCPAGSAVRDGKPCTVCSTQLVPVSCAIHRCVNGSLPKSATLPLMVRWVGPVVDGADVRIAPSEFVRSRLLETDPDDDGRIVVLPHAVPDPWQHDGDVDLPSAPYLLYAGRLTEQKGVRLLVDAVEGMGPDFAFTVVLAGDGPLREWVEERSALSGGRIRWVGQLSPVELSAYLRGAAAAVIPSVGVESFGLVAAEALGAGTPVLCTDRGALPEVVGDCGSVVDASLADLRRGLAALHIPSDQQRDAARARWRARFSAEVRGPRLAEVYRSAIATRSIKNGHGV